MLYIDKVLELSRKYKIKVLLDLHGAPGSQNGEIHSGLDLGSYKNLLVPFLKPPHYFNTDKNKAIAVQAVE